VGSVIMDAPLMTEDQKKAALQSNDKRFLIVSAEKLKGGDFGKTYKGQWKVKNQKLVRDGFGIMTWPDGSSYTGWFVNDFMCGKGRMTQCTGDVYDGEWRDN
jgi:hypothetical protein